MRMNVCVCAYDVYLHSSRLASLNRLYYTIICLYDAHIIQYVHVYSLCMHKMHNVHAAFHFRLVK